MSDTAAQGIKNNKLSPCALICGVSLRSVKYIIYTPPPPRPIEAIIAEIIPASISIKEYFIF